MKKQLSQRLIPPLLLILAGVLAYWNSFDGVFLYDDLDSIRDNPHIRVLWPLSEAMSLPLWSSAATVDGRPLLSLSFALNHALFGPKPWGFHLVNLLIHLTAGLLLFGIVRRTLDLPRLDQHSLSSSVALAKEGGEVGFRERYARSGTFLAWATAAIWLVHPLQTESVTYIVQRAESLMGMLCLLTLYCAIRGFTSEGSENPRSGDRGYTDAGKQCSLARQRVDVRSKRRWFVAAILACALGMGVKQTMVSAPLLVLLYDGQFISDSLRAALMKRWRFYAALFATWVIVFGIIAATWQESTIDFVNISAVQYLLTQPSVLLHYLRLAAWPSPMVLEYGWPLATDWPHIVFPGLAIVGLLVVMVHGLWRRRWYGFVLAWFFLILAPTSSVWPNRQAIFEHRMYLSLAAVVMLAAVGAEHAIRKVASDSKQGARVAACLVIALVTALGCRTHNRNKDFHSAIGIWQDTVTHRPANARAHLNLGNALQASGRPDAAFAHYREALRLNPAYAEAHYNWGVALAAAGRSREAIEQYGHALRIDPGHAKAHNNLAHALQVSGRSGEAVEHCREALRLNPDLPDAHFNLANALHALGRSRDAIEHYQAALRLQPGYAEAHLGWGNVLLGSGRFQDAIRQYQQALALKPNYAAAHYHWGMALDVLQRPQDSLVHYQQAVRLKPGLAEAHLNLGNAVLALGRPRDAIRHYQQALRVRPNYAHARENLQIALQHLERSGE